MVSISHFHLQQYLGAYNFGANVPSWFQEGLAEYVSGGAAMEDVSENDAVEAFLAGNNFTPDTTGSFFFPKLWSVHDEKPHMFYRQSFMFVSYLKHLDESKFRAFVLALEDNQRFDDSFNTIFGITVNEAWQQFIGHIKQRSKVDGLKPDSI